MLASAEDLSKFEEGFSNHYVQLCFPFVLFIVFPLLFVQFLIFSLYSLDSCALYNVISLLVSSSEGNKN